MSTVPSELAVEVEKVGASSTGGAPSPARRVLSTLRRSPAVILSVTFIVAVVLLAVLAPLLVKISGWGPYDFDASAVNADLGGIPIGAGGGISAEHWFGVEPQNGRDIFARIAYGAQVSLLIAVSATLVTTFIGVVLGMVAGFYGGWVDQVISRSMDFLMAFPALIFMIALLSALPAGAAGGGAEHLRLAVHGPDHPRTDDVAEKPGVRRSGQRQRRQ